MIDLEKFKKSLEGLDEELSEEEILQLMENQDQLAGILFDTWLTKINQDKV